MTSWEHSKGRVLKQIKNVFPATDKLGSVYKCFISLTRGLSVIVSVGVDLDLFVVLHRLQQPGSYCDGKFTGGGNH